jgi:hypothetical protein
VTSEDFAKELKNLPIDLKAWPKPPGRKEMLDTLIIPRADPATGQHKPVLNKARISKKARTLKNV